MTVLNTKRTVHTWPQIILFTVLGTLLCIALAFIIDCFSFEHWRFQWGSDPQNNIIIPGLIAPPIFFFLLSRMRELAIAHRQLQLLASTDSLTDCLTRRAFTTLVDAYLEQVSLEEKQRGGALLVIDVDYFKVINDEFGHDEGDQALRMIANSIKSSLREIDLVGRIGGEEFSVFLPGAAPEAAQSVAERIRQSVAQSLFAPLGKPIRMSVSVGGATFEPPSRFTQLYREADQQLYRAKRTGRNRVLFKASGTGTIALPTTALH
ncbi:GGDEF domain-containing protein [Tianweitania sp. BSSL-BM11]|uniref:diguanylate cyclase n=1 Tax=Tianweitania aestuarii TaxID=2814886 RepID=A0ABS5RW72_9HYPH|nr:GGDEF domain-containing protein [Tianweitania aestuarii]MBS9721305.1 GGDEF domain-containing protein [Tianweitania aestuarii]